MTPRDAIASRYERLLAMTQDAVWTLELDAGVPLDADPSHIARTVVESGRIAETNGAFDRRFALPGGASPRGHAPRQLPGFWLVEDAERLQDLATAGFVCGGLQVTELDPDGHLRHWTVDLVPRVEGGALRGMMAIEADITGDREEDELVREGAELFKAVTRAALDGLAVIDGSGELVDCNEAFARMAGQTVQDLLSAGRAPLRPIIEDGANEDPFERIARSPVWQGEGVLELPGGGTRSVELSCHHARGGSRAFYFFVRDQGDVRLAERSDREHQEALAHVSRLSTLGEMASGIAHEFNQPLAAIVNYANGCVRLLEQRGVDDQMVFRALRSIVDQGQRASEIIRRLRSFARRSDEDREAFSLADLLTDSIELTNQPRARARVELETDFAAGDDTVVVDGIQIEQVVMNLLLNAVEALGSLESEAPRRIRVSTRLVGDPGSSSGARPTEPLPAGSTQAYVETTVADNGPGVDEEAAQRLFEPFYSAAGKGLGLGLTIGRSIVEAHGGRLWLDTGHCDRSVPRSSDSESDGACFHFTLPLRRGPMSP